MTSQNEDAELQKTKSNIWLRRLIFFPIKLIVAFIIYSNFEYGTFIIMAYILFILSEQNNKKFVTTQEIESIVFNTRKNLGEHINKQNTNLFQRIEKLEDKELEFVELAIRVEDLENKYD